MDNFESLIKRARKRPIVEMDPLPGTTVSFGVDIVERLLPHRAPFRFVDGIVAIDLEARVIVGHCTLDAANPIFAGHFPAYPVFPGVCCIEAIGQMGLCLSSFLDRNRVDAPPADARPLDIRATRVHHAAFVGEARPGDRMTLLSQVLEADDYLATSIGQILIDGTVRAVAIGEVYFVREG